MSAKELLLQAYSEARVYDADWDVISQLYKLSSRFLESNLRTLDGSVLCNLLEQHVQLCLIVGDDNAAKLALERLVDKFGQDSSRVALLRAKHLETTESVTAAQKYLERRPESDLVAKKRLAFLKLKQTNDYKTYIEELLKYLDVMPVDSEAWSELAEAYFKTGNYSEAVHSLEEVILQVPQAYNAFARIGEIQHAHATKSNNMGEQLTLLQESCAHFLRAAELSPRYVRAWTGVVIVSGKVQAFPKLATDDAATYSKLESIARSKLRGIVDSQSATPENLAAARAILRV
jgi:tetratricopeptide (TPR) repeat protein